MAKKLRGGFFARFQDISMYTPNSATARMKVTPSCRSSSLSSLSSRSIMFRQPSLCRESCIHKYHIFFRTGPVLLTVGHAQHNFKRTHPSFVGRLPIYVVLHRECSFY